MSNENEKETDNEMPVAMDFVAETADKIKSERTFTEVGDFSEELLDREIGVLRVSGFNRKMVACTGCGKHPITRPDKYLNIATDILMAKGEVTFEGMSTLGVGVAYAAAKLLRHQLNKVKIKTTWRYVDSEGKQTKGLQPFLIHVETGDREYYQFGVRIKVKLV
jgi:hypothetical protein